MNVSALPESGYFNDRREDQLDRMAQSNKFISQWWLSPRVNPETQSSYDSVMDELASPASETMTLLKLDDSIERPVPPGSSLLDVWGLVNEMVIEQGTFRHIVIKAIRFDKASGTHHVILGDYS